MNISIKKKLYSGFGIVLFIALILAGISINKVNFISDSLSEISDVNSVKQRYAINYRGSVHDRAIAFRDVIIASNQTEINEQKVLIQTLRDFYNDSESKMQSMVSSGIYFSQKEKDILSLIKKLKTEGLVLSDKVIELTESGDKSQATTIVRTEAGPLFSKWLNVINQFIDFQEAMNQKTTPKARAEADGFQSIMLVIVAIALILSLLVARYIIKDLYNALGGEPQEAANSLAIIAEGDLTGVVQSKFKNSLLSSLAVMQSNLGSTVSDIISASGELSDQAKLVEDGSKEATEKAHRQAKQTEATLATLGIMKERLDEIAEVAIRTEANSIDTNEYSKKGIEAVGHSSKEMQRISDTVNATVFQIRKLEETTKEIGSIVSVIGSISEQTNLLALNAAIEAARAGESGRGFAVVADEVRELARRTGSATGQIEQMISQVQKETEASVAAMETTQPLVASGLELTNQTTELLSKIEEQANASLGNIKLVASATKEQVGMIHEVSSAMSNINNMARESIQSLQENMNASETLSRISENLNKTVNYFKVKR